MADPVTTTVAVGWGMKALGWLASPIISEIFKKGSAVVGFNASEKLKDLEPKVLVLERLMEVVEESPYRPRLEQLFQKLKSAFHEAEDILDDVEYHHLERQIHDDKFKFKMDRLMGKIQSALPSSPLKNEETGMPKMKLKKALEKIEHIIDDACKTLYQLNLSNIGNGNGRQIIATSVRTTGTPPLKAIGRDKDRDKIIATLHKKEGDRQSDDKGGLCYSVIGIHGISGSGKSTLAQLVCAQEKNDMQERKNDHFDLVMWFHVSQKFSVEAIYSEIIEVASQGSWGGPLNLGEQQKILEEALRDKRFFFVLDDVWCNKDPRSDQNLPQLLSPLKAGKRGSKILVTCRNADALSDLGPDVEVTPFPIHDLNDSDFLKLFMYYALGGRTRDNQDESKFWNIGVQIAQKLKRSPLAARIVGGQLRKRKNIEYWRTAKDQDLLNETMGALSWSYQHLDEQVRRCFAYCSVFPEGYPLKRDELVRLWVAEGFIRNTNSGKELEDVGQEYFDELVSTSFIQLEMPVKMYYYKDYYVMHDLLHHLAERVSGSDCFRIANGWTGQVPRGVRHLFVDKYYKGKVPINRIVELENLCTLIINSIGVDTPLEEVLESMFKRLQKLRVLSIGSVRQPNFSLPASIGLLKHLRFLVIRMGGPSCKLILPSTLNRLYHMQMLDFGGCYHLSVSSGEEIDNLVSLRYATTNISSDWLNISRSTSLQKLSYFCVTENRKLKRLRDLNKIRGHLLIQGLDYVESKEEALEAKLPDKERLTGLQLAWLSCGESSNPEVEAEVLEGLCPPMSLEALEISNYSGATYPNWMVDKQSGSPEYLQELELRECSQLGPVPELFQVFIHLRSFSLSSCSWDALPDSIEHLNSLKKLEMYKCLNVRSLPALPQSLETFELTDCDKAFMRSCQTIGDPNWQMIQHIAKRKFSLGSSSSANNRDSLKGVAFDDNVSIIGDDETSGCMHLCCLPVKWCCSECSGRNL